VDDIIVATSTREAWLEVGQPMCRDLTTIFGIKRLNMLFNRGKASTLNAHLKHFELVLIIMV
jgi:hypothetical protein